MLFFKHHHLSSAALPLPIWATYSSSVETDNPTLVLSITTEVLKRLTLVFSKNKRWVNASLCAEALDKPQASAKASKLTRAFSYNLSRIIRSGLSIIILITTFNHIVVLFNKITGMLFIGSACFMAYGLVYSFLWTSLSQKTLGDNLTT